MVEPERLAGRVINGAGEPVGGVVVVLHRVSAGSAGEVARDTTPADGRFALAVPADTTGALFFAATRHRGELYLGQPFRAGQARSDYLLPAGRGIEPVRLPGRAASDRGGIAGTAGGVEPANSDAAAGAVIVALGLLAAAALGLVVVERRRRRIPRDRTLLRQIAEVDERHRGTPADHPERQRLLGELRDVLRTGDG